MKKFLAFFLVIQITALILSGCSIPFFGKSENQTDKGTNTLDMIGLDDSTEGADSGTVDSTPGNHQPDESQQPDASQADRTPNSSSESNTSGTLQDSGLTGSGDKDAMAGSVYFGDDGVAGSTYTDADSDSSAAADKGNTSNYADGGYSSGYDENSGSACTMSDGTGQYDTGVLGVQQFKADSFSEPRRPVTVYYQDEDGCIVPMTRWIQPQPGIARAAVSLAIDSPVTREETAYYGVYPILPENTEILGIDIRNGTAVIDFNRNLLNYGTAYSERNIVAAVVYTLTEFDTIDKVKILINGYTPGLLKYGTDLSDAIGREDIMVNANLAGLPSGKEKLDLYYMKKANDSFAYPVPVSVMIDSDQTDSLPELLITQLLSYRPEGGIYSEMPEGTYLNDCYVRNGILTLDFNGKLLSYQDKSREEAILKQLAYTLRQCEGITKVNILVDGRSAELPGGTNVSAGLAVPVTINDVMDRG